MTIILFGCIWPAPCWLWDCSISLLQECDVCFGSSQSERFSGRADLGSVLWTLTIWRHILRTWYLLQRHLKNLLRFESLWSGRLWFPLIVNVCMAHYSWQFLDKYFFKLNHDISLNNVLWGIKILWLDVFFLSLFILCENKALDSMFYFGHMQFHYKL